MNHKLISLCLTFSILLIAAVFGLQLSHKATITIDLEVPNQQFLQIFWATPVTDIQHAAFSEEKSIRFTISPQKNKYQAKLTGFNKIGLLRLDPANRPAKIHINKITLSQPGYRNTILTEASLQKIIDGSFNLPRSSKPGMVLETFSEDGQFIFSVDSDFSITQYYFDILSIGKSIWATIQTRCNLLGISFFSTLLLLCDLILVLVISNKLLLLLHINHKQISSFLCHYLLTMMTVIIISTTILGALSLIYSASFLIFHSITLIILYFTNLWQQKHQRQQVNTFNDLLADFRKNMFETGSFKQNTTFFLLLSIILILFLLYLIPAIFSLPLNYDSNNYRLTRVGYWLQQNSILHYPTLDKRQLFMAVNGELVMLWITSFFKYGFPLVHLVQLFGAVMASIATYSIGRFIGYSRIWSLSSVVFFLGIPVAASQIATSQTDIFTTGCLLTGLFFLLKALRDGTLSNFSFLGIGVGLAVGAKGTVFFWGPGLVVLFLGLWIIYRTQFSIICKGVPIAICLMIFCGGFNYIQNYITFDNALAPSREIKGNVFLHKKTISKKKNVSKVDGTLLKGEALLWQIFEPSSNLVLLHPLSNSIASILEEDIRKKSAGLKSYFVNRYKVATIWVRVAHFSEDYASFGLVPFFLFLLGGSLAFYRGLILRDKKGQILLLFFVSVLCYFLFYPYVRAWSLHQYRYATLLTPFISLIAIYFFEGIRWIAWQTLIIPVLLYQISMSWMFATQGHNHSWRAMLKNGIYANNYIHYWQDTESLINQLAKNSERLGLYLGKGPWIAQLFDRKHFKHVEYITDKPSPLLLNKQFLRENNYDAVVLHNPKNIIIGDGVNVIYSKSKKLYAVKMIAAGDKQIPWLLSGDIYSDKWSKPTGRLRVGNWLQESLTISLRNPLDTQRSITITSSRGEYSFTLKAKQSKFQNVTIKVLERDTIKWSVNQTYKPWKHGNDTDTRPLGVLIRLPDLKPGTNTSE